MNVETQLEYAQHSTMGDGVGGVGVREGGRATDAQGIRALLTCSVK